jgi:signal transduction histidine kinase/ligand-binding sensor domain-containing protein
MKFLKNLPVLLGLLMLSNNMVSQQDGMAFLINHTLKFKAITVQDGLSQNWVRSIYQDDQGFIWFGTSGGLNRYDGYEFEVYNLGNVNVNAIARKNANELWICNDLGVYLYDLRKNSITAFHFLKGQTVLCVLQEEDSTVWFGSNTGLHKYTPLDDKLFTYLADSKPASGLISNYINTIFKDADENLWIGTNAGLNSYNQATDSFEKHLVYAKPKEPSVHDIMAICQDRDKRLWLGTAKDGVYLLLKDEPEDHFQKISDGAVMSLLVDSKNFLWCGMASGGRILQIDLNRFSTDKKPEMVYISKNRTDPHSLNNNSIFCLYEDKLKDIWIGTFGGGINYFSYRSKKFYPVKEGINDMPVLKNDLVNAILEEDKYLWIGTEGGLERFDKLTNKTKHFSYTSNDPNSLASNPVYSIFKDSRDKLWIGTWTGGLNCYNYTNETFRRFTPGDKPGSLSSENVFVIFEDSRSNLWIGTVSGGLNRYNYETQSFISYRHDSQNPKSLYSNIVHDIEETSDGRLMVAAFGSLDVLDTATGNFTHYPLNSLYPDNSNSRYVITIFKDSRDHIWLGTNDGLLLFNEDSTKSILYTMQHGLSGNTIQGIVEDQKGNLWITTTSGLSRFNHAVEHPEKADFTNFDESDGLSGNEFNKRAIYQNKSGYLYLGSSQGFSYFHPDSILLNTHLPEIVLVEMNLLKYQQNNLDHLVRNINSLEKIELPYSKSDFEISFAALNFLNPQKNKYKYMLGGYDRDWIVAEQNRTATYKNLRPGKYTFMVLGSNNDGLWNTRPKTLEITIIPPFWQTLGFKGLLIFALMAIVLLAFRWRVKSIQKEKRKLEKLVAERTIELREANNKLEDQSEELLNQNEELRQSQEQLSVYKDQLEELVIQRTSELEKAKTKAEESDRLKTMFLANMSHEIRTPLNAIAGFSSLFNEPGTNEEDRKTYQQIIQNNIESLLRLINDILDLSTIEANQIKIYYAPFSPADVFLEVYHQFLPQATQEVTFHLKIEEKSRGVIINSDEYRFRQILSNLISNAFKFTEAGSIETGFYSDGQNRIVCYVKDTGIGISKDEQELVFSHFTKVEKPSKLFRGAGLGLAICRELTELLGGKIWLESEPGKGSTFYFSHPI